MVVGKMTKSELRKLYLAKRQSLSAEERAVVSRKVADNFFADFDLNAFRFLHCFISIEKLNEIDTRPIFEKVWREFPAIQTVVPRVNHETGDLESLTYARETELSAGKWQISEPSHDELVEPHEIDVVLVPLLCFDQQGHRVGYGKGFYDRFLRQCRTDCLKIGLCSFEPVDKIDDAHAGDIRLDFSVTPDNLYPAVEKLKTD